MKWLVSFLLILSFNCYATSDSTCLSAMLKHEAQTESKVATRAVLDVTLNRVAKSRKTACRVIKEPGAYSWHHKNYKFKVIEKDLTRLSEIGNMSPVLDEDYLWFFNKRLHPIWAKKLKCDRIIGMHKFCKEKK